jgi:protein CpxP
MYGFTRKHLAGFVLASGVALGVAPVAYANGAEGMPHGPGGRHAPMGMQGPMGMHGGPMAHLRGLGLSEAQRDQVFKLFHEQAPGFHEQMKQVRHARQELHKLAMAENFDEAKVRDAANAQAKAMADLAVLHAQTMNRVRSVLTPEQRSRMEQMEDGRRGRGPR